VPRWEWRSFTRIFADAPDAASAAGAVTEETYLVSLVSPHNVKIRNDRLAIKRLVRSDDAGLELWQPVLESAFPIGDAAATAVFGAWGMRVPEERCPRCSLADFMQKIIVPNRDLRIVTLSKQRVPIEVAGCRGERGQIVIGRHRWNTVAFEDADPARIHAALRELGLDPGANESYPAALKRIQGLPDHSAVVRSAAAAS
jgi:hypothetical protein